MRSRRLLISKSQQKKKDSTKYLREICHRQREKERLVQNVEKKTKFNFVWIRLSLKREKRRKRVLMINDVYIIDEHLTNLLLILLFFSSLLNKFSFSICCHFKPIFFSLVLSYRQLFFCSSHVTHRCDQ